MLGAHQDAIVATTELEHFLTDHPHDQGLARRVSELIEAQRETAQTTRARFFKVWKKLDRKKSLRWFKRKAHSGD